MKSISVDFANERVCIMAEGQQGTEHYPDIKKVALNSFIPVEYRDNDSFTWDFENETIAVNLPYHLMDGAIMTKDNFVPRVIIPMKGLKDRYEEFIAILGYEEVDLREEMPRELRHLLGL